MPRVSIYVDAELAAMIEAAWPGDRNLSAIFQRAILAAVETMPPSKRKRVYAAAAAGVVERLRARL